jgi:hypothetical protein
MDKRLVAPVLITAGIILFCLFYVAVWFFDVGDLSILALVIGLAVAVVFIGLSVYVLMERIKEIRSGEEDDLGKY